MASQSPESGTAKKAQGTSRTIYLTCYNVVFALLWATSFVIAASRVWDGKVELFNATEAYVRWVQTLSLIEVVHAAVGKFPLQST